MLSWYVSIGTDRSSMPTLRETTLGQYLDDISSASPTPGGGRAAAHLALAALRASLLNVHINNTVMKDEDAATAFETSASELADEATDRCQRVIDHVIARIRG